MRLLLVEDDTLTASLLTYALEEAGYLVDCATTVKEAKAMIGSQAYHLAILDIRLPDGTGFELVEALKKQHISILFLTVVDDENKIVRAFEDGASDYVVKPFRLRELLARIKRILENQPKQPTILSVGDVTIHLDSGKVYIKNEIIELTALEYRLLVVLATNKGQILSRNQILDYIWDQQGHFVENNTLTVYIKRLRDKLGNAISIETVRGFGYRAY